MKKAAGLLLFIFFFITSVINAQDTYIIPSLGYNPNPQSFGLGGCGVSISSNDPMGFYYNPAILGFAAQTNNLSVQFYPDKINWLSSNSQTFSNTGFSAGYNFSKLLDGINLSAGIGYISSDFEDGWYGIMYGASPPDGLIEGYNKYNAVGVGISLDYYANLSFGITYKNIDSRLSGNIYWDSWGGYEVKVSAIDWGLLLNLPVSKLAFPNLIYSPVTAASFKPVVNLSLGYSRSNIGKEVYYVDPSHKIPLPITARLGYTLSLGADLLLANTTVNFFTYDYTVEAENFLFSFDERGNYSYHGLLGDIKPGVNLIQGKRSDNVTLRKGAKLSLLETVSFLNGSYFTGYVYESGNISNGIILSSNGFFKVLSSEFNNNQYLKYFLDHFEIQYVIASVNHNYTRSILDQAERDQTEIKAVSLSFNRFTL